MNATPRIYVACLASYNNGILHGAWIDADQSAEDIHAEIASMLAASPIPLAEEFAIHDFEYFGEVRLGEYESIESVAELGAAIAAHPAFAAYASHVGVHCATVADFEESYCGQWDSFRDFSDDLVEQLGILDGTSETVSRYFDYDAFARDLAMDYVTTCAEDGGVDVFRVL